MLSVAEAVRQRRSVRAFQAREVPEAMLREIFSLAQLASSNCNTQPWIAQVVSGAKCNVLRQRLTQAGMDLAQYQPDFPYDGRYPGIYKERQHDAAAQLHGAMGITREGHRRGGQPMPCRPSGPRCHIDVSPLSGTPMRVALVILACLCALAWPAVVRAQAVDARAASVAQMREQLAYHVGTLAYVWGYPMVDMSKQMHNETHRTAAGQQALAPLNHFYRYEQLVTPSTAGNLRAPNNDTLYFGGWFDVSREPVIVHAPDTSGRYYTLALTDFFNEVTHLGRRTTGTADRHFALVGPGWTGTLPGDVHVVRLATRQVWILGRLLVDGEADFPAALALMRGFWSAPLSQFIRGTPPTSPAVTNAAPVDPLDSLEFFAMLNRWLRANDARPDEGALLGLFDQVGIGPKRDFAADKLDPASKRGLERALTDGRALVRATAQQPLPDVRNGWIFPLGLADYGHDYLMRAGVVFGGYANRPEETAYVARTVDEAGQLMTGAGNYHLHLEPAQIPPAGAFWSLAAYDLKTFSLIENPLRRYSLGNRTPGLAKNADGSLDLYLQKQAPAEGPNNWLPVGDGPFFLVMRIYEPARAVFDGSYRLPPLRRRP